jgi:hypothetical protein
MSARVSRWLVPAGVAGLLLSGVGWWTNPGAFYAGWLAAFVLLSAWPLGSMALLLTHALTGGRWGDTLRPALRTGVSALPLVPLAFLPLLTGFAALFPWANEHFANHFWLNPRFFAVRCVIYVVLWLLFAWLTLRRAEASGVAAPGLVMLAFTVTFASIDTTMSLDPHFVSSIYGMLSAAGMTLLALSLAILFTAESTPCDAREDLGKLLLALVILWIYLDFMQLLIIWQSDLAAEVPWYLARSRGFWGAVRAIVAVGHFVLPFFLLLSTRARQSRRALIRVASLLVVMEVIRAWWTILPSLGLTIGWIDIACVAGLGCIAARFAFWLADRPALVVARDV